MVPDQRPDARPDNTGCLPLLRAQLGAPVHEAQEALLPREPARRVQLPAGRRQRLSILRGKSIILD